MNELQRDPFSSLQQVFVYGPFSLLHFGKLELCNEREKKSSRKTYVLKYVSRL